MIVIFSFKITRAYVNDILQTQIHKAEDLVQAMTNQESMEKGDQQPEGWLKLAKVKRVTSSNYVVHFICILIHKGG